MNKNDLTGKVLHDTHRITRLIGQGGMGEVYEAVHARLGNKRFAIKVLRDKMQGAQGIYTRFRREAEIATQLGHPNIVEVLDFYDAEDGRPCIVMELLEGESLHSLLDRHSKLSPTRLLEVFRQMGSALQAAHDHGIVHRDLKPANIFLCDSPDLPLVKLVDFGISKIRDSNTQLTGDQDVLGTPHYMSPEQGRGEVSDVDQTTDIFAAGIICYQALCGRLPFDAPTLPGVIYKVCFEEPVPASRLLSGLPLEVDGVLSRAMAKERARRYQQIRDFVDDLQRAMTEVEIVQFAPTGRMPAVEPPDDDGPLDAGEDAAMPGPPEGTDLQRLEEGATISTDRSGPESPTEHAEEFLATLEQPGRAPETGVGEQSTITGSTGESLVEPNRGAARTRAGFGPVAGIGLVAALVLTLAVYLWLGRVPPSADLPAGPAPTSGHRAAGDRGPASPAGSLSVVASTSPDGEALATVPDAATRVQITLELEPARATVWVDGIAHPENPLVLETSNTPHSLRVQARGYQPHQQALLADATRTLRITLKKKRPRRRRPRANTGGGKKKTPAASGDQGPGTGERKTKTRTGNDQRPVVPAKKKTRPREGFRSL